MFFFNPIYLDKKKAKLKKHSINIFFCALALAAIKIYFILYYYYISIKSFYFFILYIIIKKKNIA